MRVSRLVIAAFLATGAASLLGAVVTRPGVGPLEYLTSALIVVLLARTAFAVARRARHV
jgi:hypothetical protein